MIESIWDQFLIIIKDEVGSRVVETWFKAVSLDRWDATSKTVYLKAPNSFVCNWIQSNYTKLLQDNLSRLLNVKEVNVEIFEHDNESIQQKDYKPAQKIELPSKPDFLRSDSELNQDLKKNQNEHKIPSLQRRSMSTKKKEYTFDTFVVGPSNSLAFAAAKAIAEKPGLLYNPLFIYGGSGLGKTHLIHAIGAEITKKNTGIRVLYQPADQFVTEFISAVRFDKVHAFKVKYRMVDVLLVDDIHCISNKEQTQEAFFHIFNALYESRKQIVFSSDTFPQNIQGLAERLRSRLTGGLIVDIQIPPLETKIAILSKKAQAHSYELPSEIACFIASLEFINIRELEGALIRVLAFASLTRQELTLDLTKKVLSPVVSQPIRTADFKKITQIIQRYYKVSFDQLVSVSRRKDIVQARQVTIYFMKDMTQRSSRDIGEFLGDRDHSTVLHSYNKIKNCIAKDPSFLEYIKKIKQDILYK